MSADELRQALMFYADPDHWVADGAIQSPGQHPLVESPAGFDKGERARQVLNASPNWLAADAELQRLRSQNEDLRQRVAYLESNVMSRGVLPENNDA